MSDVTMIKKMTADEIGLLAVENDMLIMNVLTVLVGDKYPSAAAQLQSRVRRLTMLLDAHLDAAGEAA